MPVPDFDMTESLFEYLDNHPCDDDLITGSYVRDSDD